MVKSPHFEAVFTAFAVIWVGGWGFLMSRYPQSFARIKPPLRHDMAIRLQIYPSYEENGIRFDDPSRPFRTGISRQDTVGSGEVLELLTDYSRFAQLLVSP